MAFVSDSTKSRLCRTAGSATGAGDSPIQQASHQLRRLQHGGRPWRVGAAVAEHQVEAESGGEGSKLVAKHQRDELRCSPVPQSLGAGTVAAVEARG